MKNLLGTDLFSTFTKAQCFVILFFLILITFYNTYEIYDELHDLRKGESLIKTSTEIFIMSSSIIFIFYILRIIYKNHSHQKTIEQALIQIKEQLHTSNQRLEQGKDIFHSTVEWQLNEWQLTKSQKNIAILLLKGLNTREIAEIQDIQEKTVRNHLSAIYDKSGLSGRHVFCAWFFETVTEIMYTSNKSK